MLWSVVKRLTIDEIALNFLKGQKENLISGACQDENVRLLWIIISNKQILKTQDLINMTNFLLPAKTHVSSGYVNAIWRRHKQNKMQ